jgi:hypothetical protein
MGMMAFTVWFSRYFKIHNITLLACNSIIICSSFTREMLVTGQVTGLIFGALALIAHLSDKFLFNKTFYALPLITLLSALVIDLKPNIFLFPFLAIILIYRNSMVIKTLIAVPILYTILFLGLIQWTEVNLLRSWISNLNAINDYTSNNTLFGSKNGWQVINGLVESNGLPFLFSVIPVVTYLLVGIVGLLLVGKARPAIGVSFTLISPFFYTYFHFYSFFPLALVFSLYLSQKRNYLLMGVFLSTFLASYRIVENLPVLVIAVILLVPILLLDASIKDIFLFVLGWLSFIPARLVLLKIVQGEIQYMSVLLSLLMLLWFSLFVHMNQKREAVAVK